MSDNTPYLIIVGGPTASGKTGLAIQLAQHFKTVVLSADSRQFYQGMRIGTAQPNAEELAAVKHYFINDRPVDKPLNAGAYADEALAQLQELFKQHRVVIVCGGTGLYIRALIDGLDTFPAIDPNFRETLMQELEEKGLEVMNEELAAKDPSYFALVDKQNPHRIIRALEVIRATGNTYSSYLQKAPTQRPFKTIQLAIDLKRNDLYERINKRVDLMIEEGLEDEVHLLKDYFHLNALQTVGYKEWQDYFNNTTSKEQCIEDIKQHSRNYAKRQITWFKRDERVHWLNAANKEEAITYCEQIMNEK